MLKEKQKLRTEKRKVYVMTCGIGFENEETGELEEEFLEEYTASTIKELETMWESFHKGESAGIYGEYEHGVAYFMDHIISDEPEEREFYV